MHRLAPWRLLVRKALLHQRCVHWTSGSTRARYNALCLMLWLAARVRESGRSALAITEHDGADTGSRKHHPVDRYTSGPFRRRLNRHRLIEDSIGWLTHREIRDDAASTRMNKGFA